MAFASFCGLLTLQVGSAILATVFFVIGVLVFGVNSFEYRQNPLNSWPVDLLLVFIFVVLMILSGLIIFLSAYNESRSLCILAVGVIVITTVYWLTLTIFSLVNHPTDVRRVCIEHRCGESFWLANFNYRTYSRVWTTTEAPFTDESPSSSDTSTTGTTTTVTTTTVSTTPARFDDFQIKKKREIDSQEYLTGDDVTEAFSEETTSTLKVNVPVRDMALLTDLSRLESEDYDGYKEPKQEETENNNYKYGSALVGAIVFAIVNLVFFIFSMVIMWSYGQELKWGAYYYDSSTPTYR